MAVLNYKYFLLFAFLNSFLTIADLYSFKTYSKEDLIKLRLVAQDVLYGIKW